MKSVVVDTNVGLVANGKAEQASPECVLTCIDRFERIREKEKVLLDDGMYILHEYMSNLSMSGQPGMGDAFMKWVWENQANPGHCLQIHITPKEPGSDDFEEFPNDPDLRDFDMSDRKFVAVSIASGLNPPVLNASDKDWWEYRKPLERNGVQIDFLCPELMLRNK